VNSESENFVTKKIMWNSRPRLFDRAKPGGNRGPELFATPRFVVSRPYVLFNRLHSSAQMGHARVSDPRDAVDPWDNRGRAALQRRVRGPQRIQVSAPASLPKMEFPLFPSVSQTSHVENSSPPRTIAAISALYNRLCFSLDSYNRRE